MKKSFFLFLVFTLQTFCFAQELEENQKIKNSYKYQITNVNYEITASTLKFLPKTKEYAIELNETLDKKRIFESKQELDSYLLDYELRLNNLRAFETVVVSQSFTISEDENPTIIPVFVKVQVKDSIHIIALPYPKYNSNDGFVFKLKAKDTNFLGSLNTMDTSFNFQHKEADEINEKKTILGFNFGFDYPFKVGIFDLSWCNDYSFSYTLGNSTPEWDAKTGIEMSKTFDKMTSFLRFYQSFNKNLDYDYDDNSDATYFGEEIKLQNSFFLTETENFGKLKYAPYINFVYNWDRWGKDSSNYGINPQNSSLSSPYLTVGHSLSLGRVNWLENLRTGLEAELSNNFKYNFQRKILYPEVSVDVKAYKSFSLLPTKNFMNRWGISSRFYAFFDIFDYNNQYFKDDGTNIGAYLRGIRDNQYFGEEEYSSWYALKTPSAIILSLDFPIHIFETHIKTKFLRTFNFDLQISPFIDVALTYNKATKRYFSLKDGLYAGGIEVLVYPTQFKSFTVRGSLGIDLGRFLLSDYLDTSWRYNCSKYEISIGVGLQY